MPADKNTPKLSSHSSNTAVITTEKNDNLKDPMRYHKSREYYFKKLKQDPYGFNTKRFDWTGEDKFIAVILPLSLLGIAIILFGQQKWGWPGISRYAYLLYVVWIGAEMLGKLFFSTIVMRLNVKINYMRKLGLRPWRKLKSYVIPFILVSWFGISKDASKPIVAVCMFVFLDNIKTIFLEWHRLRRRSKILSHAFICWDRLEDRPYTLRYDILEDVFRFLIYVPFMFLFGKESILVILPQFVNEFGDGLAEPVGIRFGKHKYRVRSLWYNGKFWSGNFVRSLEGSAMVFLVSFIGIFIFREHFTQAQLYFLYASFPLLMTFAEAISPHTNDGPAMGLVGCTNILAALKFF